MDTNVGLPHVASENCHLSPLQVSSVSLTSDILEEPLSCPGSASALFPQEQRHPFFKKTASPWSFSHRKLLAVSRTSQIQRSPRAEPLRCHSADILVHKPQDVVTTEGEGRDGEDGLTDGWIL